MTAPSIVLPPDLTADEADYLASPDPEDWVASGACNYVRQGVSRDEALKPFFLARDSNDRELEPQRIGGPAAEAEQVLRDRALALCATCPVSERCLDYALEHQIDFGIWGGKNRRERNAIRRARVAAGTMKPRSKGAKAWRGE